MHIWCTPKEMWANKTTVVRHLNDNDEVGSKDLQDEEGIEWYQSDYTQWDDVEEQLMMML